MLLGFRDWQVVVRALVRLGCTVFYESDTHMFIARANVRQQAVGKMPIHPDLERIIVEALGFTMVAYQAALAIEERSDN